MAGAVDITQTFGLVALGTILGTLFYGITLLQTGLYFSNTRKLVNARRTTIMVILLVILDTVTWILETYTTWWYFVQNFANPAQLAIPFWALQLEPGFTYTVAFLAQMFFIEKIWHLSGSYILGGLTTFIALIAWTTGLAITGLVFAEDVLVSPLVDKVNIAQKTSSTVIELSIGILMTYYLYERKGGLKDTDNILNRLIVFALSRGLILGLNQLGYTIVFFGFPHKLYWVVFHFSLSKLASNSVLASLNVREIIRTGRSTGLGSGDTSDRSRRAGAPSTTGRPLISVTPRSPADASANSITLHGAAHYYHNNSGTQIKSTQLDDGSMDVPMEPLHSIDGDRKVHPYGSAV